VLRAASDPLLAMFRVAMMPPKASGESLEVMRSSFVDLWNDPQFLADYSKVIKTEPILVMGSEGQETLTELSKVRREIKDFLIDYTGRLTTR
jgi:hypothetical protein